MRLNTSSADGAAFADKNNLWIAKRGGSFKNVAKIPVNIEVGTNGRTGEKTIWIDIHRTNTGFVHGFPSKPPSK